MVLPVRIELTTSALPRMRSTTELRQHLAKGASRQSELCRGPAGEAALWPGGMSDVKAVTVAKRDEEREKRLAEALRENLRRRKAQRREAPEPPGKTAPE
jgi:shikimate 5-dehydrogenase